IYVEFSSVITEEKNGKIMISIGRDVTEKIKAKEALRKSEQNFETIIREMPEGVLIMDREKVTFANQALAQMLGFASAAELIGRKTLELIHQDFHGHIRQRIDRVLDMGEANPLTNIKM